jgi:hypothetical protein
LYLYTKENVLYLYSKRTIPQGGSSGIFRECVRKGYEFMQDTKDTFFATLRNRIAAGNPARTVIVRGIQRPGVLVVENELPTAWVPPDVFLMSWTGMRVDNTGAVPLVAMTCSIRYGTDGDADTGGMDRGRLMGAMYAELGMALGAGPQGVAVRNVRKVNYAGLAAASGTGVAVAMETNIFWGDVAFGPVVMVGERLERTATVDVFGFVEAGS